MTTALVAAVLLALLGVWGLAICQSARRRRLADPIGDIFAIWLAGPPATSDTPCRRGRAPRRRITTSDPEGDPALSYLSVTKFARPPVYATANDLARLRGLAHAAPRNAPGADLLLQEVARMTPAPDASPEPHVRLGAAVCYKDLRTKRMLRVRIVEPEAAEPDDNRISILSPIGAALIGLRRGSIFRWLAADGAPRAIKVIDVEP